MTNSSPVTKTVFSNVVSQSGIDKVDLLFMIDNSRSMGDKQDYLARAVPDLLTRLLTPNCIDDATGNPNGHVSDPNGVCASGTPEFPPVHDMHIGIISSALGSMGGNLCPAPAASPTAPNGQDDDGQLLNRTQLADASPSSFLEWYPTAGNGGTPPPPGQPAVTAPATLVSDFQSLVKSLGEQGCGIESQLESWYRFLVQPDPYSSITVTGGAAQFQGIDATILKQRHDFLRPDSLLAIIDLSDENDSTIDVRMYPQKDVAGYHMMEGMTAPYRATSACATNPADPACTSCNDQSPSTQNDPACNPDKHYAVGGSAPGQAPGTPNIRHVRMKQNFGIDSQYPITRYVAGLNSPMVPDRDGEYPAGAMTYQGNANCANPIFSKDLPDGTNLDSTALCNLKPGARSPIEGLVFYAHIGGVPHDLLQQDPTNPDSPQKDTLTTDDWTKILGQDPASYDATGIDPRMVETYKVRPWPEGTTNSLGVATSFSDYWDLDFACTFPLAAPRNCTLASNQSGCDCAFAAGMGTAGHTWELCDPNDPTKQVAAKAYPTVRELWLAKLLGAQGVVASLCPIHAQPANGDMPPDPLYGYRPAMNSIVNRLAAKLTSQCLPHKLDPDSQGAVPCLVLASLPDASSSCDPAKGQSPVDPHVVADASQSLQGLGAGTFDPSQHTVCQVDEVTGGDLVNGTCRQANKAGWCYVTGAAAGGKCQQALFFSPNALPSTGTVVAMVCIEAASATSAL